MLVERVPSLVGISSYHRFANLAAKANVSKQSAEPKSEEVWISST